ncbi:hypothetical protein DY000_02041000 [Brassica cretica]|uniref:Uncharacterized protein n=1 Tax=Brassica cretica TaxID=69181 RepID=A0ABQ7BF22_BRACR|nr:hypothetical protein DY000_02041000 [Brassica cretica]
MADHGQASFWTQRKHIWMNVRLVLVPLFLCLLLLSIQLLIEAVMNKVSDMAKYGSKVAPNGDYCPIPTPPLLPPMLHIPEPESRAVKAGFFPYSDLPNLSCRKTKTCPLTMLVTVWRFMFCFYLSTVESKKSLNGCLSFRDFSAPFPADKWISRCGLLFFSEVSGPLIFNLLLRLKYSQKFFKGQWDKEDCVAELNNYIDRLLIFSLANTNRKQPDILGELTAIRSTINDGTHGSQQVILTLHIDRDVYECVSLFDGLAYVFHDKLKSYGSEPKVVLGDSGIVHYKKTAAY